MSDTFDFSNVDFSNVDPSTLADTGSALLALAPTPSTWDFGTFTPAGGTPLLPPVLNLPGPATPGLTGVITDLTRLIGTVYASEAQVTAAQSAAAIARARAANQLETVRTTPNVWLVLGLGAAGFFALELMDRHK